MTQHTDDFAPHAPSPPEDQVAPSVHGSASYSTPSLRRLGAAAELTRSRSMIGMMDGGGGSGMNRTG